MQCQPPSVKASNIGYKLKSKDSFESSKLIDFKIYIACWFWNLKSKNLDDFRNLKPTIVDDLNRNLVWTNLNDFEI